MNSDLQCYTVSQVASILGITEETTLAMIHRGELPASNLNTKPDAQRPRWRILGSDLGQYLLKTRLKPSIETTKPKRRSRPTAKDYFP